MNSNQEGPAGAGGPVRRSRVGGWWVALVAAAFVLLLLMIFVLQNGDDVQVSFLGSNADLPLGIALLLAAIAGVLIVAIPGTGRILQLRHLARQRTTQRARPRPPAGTDPAVSAPADEPADPAPPNGSDNQARHQPPGSVQT